MCVLVCIESLVFMPKFFNYHGCMSIGSVLKCTTMNGQRAALRTAQAVVACSPSVHCSGSPQPVVGPSCILVLAVNCFKGVKQFHCRGVTCNMGANGVQICR